VWFRNGPDWNNTSGVTGWGVYKGDRVQLLCWQTGADNALRKVNGQKYYGGNNVWYIANNLTRPTRPGGANSGWINAHYVNDGMPAYKVAPGVPACVGGRPPATSTPQPAAVPSGGSVYYSPYGGDTITYHYGPGNKLRRSLTITSLATKTLYSGKWEPSKGNKSMLDDFAAVVSNRRITTLSGWSVGRQGPVYYLREFQSKNPGGVAPIHYIVLFDPGAYGELTTDTYRSEISGNFQKWLQSNGSNRLVIFAGATTRDASHPSVVNGKKYYHRGIQEVYFPKIRGTNTASRVTVCNYDAMSHEDVWINFQLQQNFAPITSSCPTAPDGTKANALWHP
jgi:hypothetical protein